MIAAHRLSGVASLALVCLVLGIAASALVASIDESMPTAWSTRALVLLAQDRTWFAVWVATIATVGGYLVHLDGVAPAFTEPADRSRSATAPWLAASAGGLVLVTALAGVVVAGARDSASPRAALVLMTSTTALALALCGFTAWRALGSLADSDRRSTVGAFSVGLVLGALAYALYDFRPYHLQRWTLLAVNALVHALFDDAVSDLSIHAVGTERFRVRIFPSCSGIEGMLLGLLLVIPYLRINRERLRFPRALVLLPVVLAALAAANVARIVLFIAVGQVASSRAAEAFHSSVGWFLFATTLGATIPVSERLFRLRRDPPLTSVDDAAHNPAIPYLLPLVVASFVAILLSMLSLGASPMALARYAFAAVVLGATLPRAERIALPRGSAPWLTGLLVAAVYVALTPSDAVPSPLVATTFGGVSTLHLSLHFVGFAVVTPLVEELAFRGYLLRRLEQASFDALSYRSTGPVALVVSSLAFGAMHGAFLQASVAGLLFGWLARRGDGLGGAIVAHAVANGSLAVFALATGRLGVIG